MSCAIQAAGAIELYFYGDLPARDRFAVQAHLTRCIECRQALEDLSLIRAALASRPDVAAPPDEDWSAFMVALNDATRQSPENRVLERRRIAVQPESRGARAAERVRMLVMSANVSSGRHSRADSAARGAFPYLAMAALLAVITFTVLTVVRQREEAVPQVGLADAVFSSPPAGHLQASYDPALASLTNQHFQRSKLVVLGLATRDPSKPGEDNWEYERDLATRLLSDTQLYRLAAEERGMNTLAGVMRDLELVLLQASMSQDPDHASLEQLQRLIRRRDLLTKMNVVHRGGS
jgi:hypothetical protein